MRFSRLGVFLLLTLAVFLTANCGYYTRIMSRKNLVDGSHAYKERKFQAAEELFRNAAARDPEGLTLEGKTAQVFLARTLHSQYIGNRNPAFGEQDFLGEGLAGTRCDRQEVPGPQGGQHNADGLRSSRCQRDGDV